MSNPKRGSAIDITNFPINFAERAIAALATATPDEATEIHYELGLYYSQVRSDENKALEHFWLVLKQGSINDLRIDAGRQIEDISIRLLRNKVAEIVDVQNRKITRRVTRAVKKLVSEAPITECDEASLLFMMSLWELRLSRFYVFFACYPYPSEDRLLPFKEDIRDSLKFAVALEPRIEQISIAAQATEHFHQLHTALKRACKLFEE